MAERPAAGSFGEKFDHRALERLLDEVAVQDEHSQVDAATRERIRQLITAGGEQEPAAATARRIVEALSAEQLTQLVSDWLEAQTAI